MPSRPPVHAPSQEIHLIEPMAPLRAVIRNPAKGDVNVVKVDGKVDKTVYANMFWDSL